METFSDPRDNGSLSAVTCLTIIRIAKLSASDGSSTGSESWATPSYPRVSNAHLH